MLWRRLTGDAEAKHIVIFFHELLQQSALPCPGRAAEHHRPGSSHSWGRVGKESWNKWVRLEELTHIHWNPMAWVIKKPSLSVCIHMVGKKRRCYSRLPCLDEPHSARINTITWKHSVSQRRTKWRVQNISHKSNQLVGKPWGYRGAITH